MQAKIDKLSTPKAPFGSSMVWAFGNRRFATFHVIPGPSAAMSPEFIIPSPVVMDSGLAAPLRSGMTGSPLDLREIRHRAGRLADLIEEPEPIFA